MGTCLTCLVLNVGCVSYDRRLLNFWECFLFLQLLTGTVSSLEDHGYLVDIGVSGARAFLPLQKAQEYIRQKNKGEGKEKDECMVVRWSVGIMFKCHRFSKCGVPGLLKSDGLVSLFPT